MVNRRDGQFARWLIGSMVDRSDSERLRGFCDGLMYRRTFAILESLLRLKIYSKCDSISVKQSMQKNFKISNDSFKINHLFCEILIKSIGQLAILFL